MLLHAERRGRGPTVVLLHGFTGSTRVWREVEPLLAPYVELVAVDLRCHGSSPGPPFPDDDTFSAIADDVWETLNALHVPLPVAVVGHSLGGAAAIDMVLAQPGAVRALALVEPMDWGRASDPSRVAFMERCIATARGGGMTALADWLEQQDAAGDAAQQQERAERRAGLLDMTPDGYEWMMRAALTWDGRLDRIASIEARTTFWVGEPDFFNRRATVHGYVQRAAREAGAQIISWPAGHMPQLETPLDFAQFVAISALGRLLPELLPPR